MMNINLEGETKKIVRFLRKKFHEQDTQNTSPHIPKNVMVIPIKNAMDEISKILKLASRNKKIVIENGKKKVEKSEFPLSNFQNHSPFSSSQFLKIRIGNIMARVRMIILFDLAKKHNGLVCGTENKSEHLLGYFTRFGDAASDIEPIAHLYKTQVYQLAKYLGVSQSVINQKPSAGLWSGQTDEAEFGFAYEEADQVLYLFFDKKMSTEKIVKMGYRNAKKILEFVKKNEFKRKTPYYV